MSLPILFFYGFAFMGMIHAIIYSIGALRYNRQEDLIINLFLLAQSIIILEFVFYWTGLNRKYYYLNGSYLTIMFLFGPLLYLYKDLVFKETKKRSIYILHFTPAIIIFILMLPFYLRSPENRQDHFRIPYFILNLNYLSYLSTAHMALYFTFLFINIKKVRRVGHINNWLFVIIGLFGFYVLCNIAYLIMVKFPWFNITTDYFVSIGMCLSILFIIYVANGKNIILDGFKVSEAVKMNNLYSAPKENDLDNSHSESNYIDTGNVSGDSVRPSESNLQNIKSNFIKYKNSGLSESAANELAGRLKKLMEEEKLYKESELSLEKLADRLNAPRHFVSQVINQYAGLNFFEYINELRINEAKLIFDSTPKSSLNIIEVAYEVGYNTKNTFNNAFRRITGKTPSEYRSNQSDN